MIEDRLQRALGILGDEKRIYRFEEGEVSREEFEHCVLIDQVVFGPKGYVESLGPTWEMIHDPRFVNLEGKFIVRRKGVFGGDATLGRQYIDSKGNFTSSIVDLEQYSDILGEGRNLFCFLQHPESKCPEREWLERTWKQTLYKSGPDVVCLCNPEDKTDPRTWKDMPDYMIWQLIKREWPNYFRLNALETATAEQLLLDINHPDPKKRFKLVNQDGARLYNLCKADLVGLIADYAETAHADDWTSVDSDEAANKGEGSESYKVAMEVDYLEKALSYRASLRATAAKILNQIGFNKQLKELEKIKGYDNTRLTDQESDRLLRIVYQSDYPNDKVELVNTLATFVINCFQIPYIERLKEQLETASDKARQTISGLKDGSVKPVNQDTDAEPEDTRTLEKRYSDYVAQMKGWGETPSDYEIWFQSYQVELIQNSLFKNPLKKDLFLICQEAERNAYNDVADLDNRQVICETSLAAAAVLAPVFATPDVQIGEKEYEQYMVAVRKTGYFQLAQKAYEEEYHSKDSYHRGLGPELDPKTLDPLPQSTTDDDVWVNALSKLKPKGNA